MTGYTRTLAGQPSDRCRHCSKCMGQSYGGVIIRVYCTAKHEINEGGSCRDFDEVVL